MSSREGEIMVLFKNLYTYRELLKSNVKKEIRGKYKGSVLGILWSFINPLLTVLVYAIVFPYIMRVEQDHYLIFLITAIIPWTFFTTVIQQGTLSIRVNAGIIKKVYFPREIMPISVAISGLINFFVSCLIILVFVLFDGVGISWHLVFLPLIAIIQMMFSLGLVLILSSVNVYIKDIEYIVGFIIQMLFYGTPILYPLSLFENANPILIKLVEFNPMTQIVLAYRDIFMNHQIPSALGLVYVFILSIIILVIGFVVFRKLERRFAEEL